jgi:hypothetical protein
VLVDDQALLTARPYLREGVMSHLPLGFAERYAGALDAHLAEPSDASLAAAHRLGEIALAEGISNDVTERVRADSVVRHGVIDAEIAYLRKPITPETLTRKVREVLDGP